MDKQLLISKALGINGEHFERWSRYSVDRQDKDRDDMGNRFDIDGPIVGSDMECYMGEGTVGYATPAMLRKFLQEHEGEDIEITINSPGGSVFDANAMVSDLLRHKGAIGIVVTGACFSAAADFLAIPNAHRTAMPGSMVMIHEAWTIAAGDSKQLQKVVNRLEKINDMCADRFESATNYSKDELLSMMEEETFFTDQEALDGGFVDEIYEMDEDEDAEMNESEDDNMSAEDLEIVRKSVQRKDEALDATLQIIL